MASASVIITVSHARGTRGYHISKAKHEDGLKDIQNRINELKLDVKSPKAKIIGSNKRKQTIGTDAAEESFIGCYKVIWKGLLDFCIEIKDYDSAIILAHDICPKDPLPVDINMAISYLCFHVLKAGTELTHHETNEPILDAVGNPMKCLGDWQSESGVKLFGTALSKLHKHYKTTSGDYLNECTDCSKMYHDNNCKDGCHRHINSLQIWCKGCPTTDLTFKNKHKQMKQYAECTYSAWHTFTFLPGELHDIRQYLLSTNNLYCLMIWTIIIVRVKEFMHIDEVLDMDIDQFNDLQGYFVVTENNIEALAAWVYGKTDQEKVNLII